MSSCSCLPQHVAFSTDRIAGLAPEPVARLRELGLLYDREAGGEFVHFYTAALGAVFFEVASGTAATTATGPLTRPSGWRRSAEAGPVSTPESGDYRC